MNGQTFSPNPCKRGKSHHHHHHHHKQVNFGGSWVIPGWWTLTLPLYKIVVSFLLLFNFFVVFVCVQIFLFDWRVMNQLSDGLFEFFVWGGQFGVAKTLTAQFSPTLVVNFKFAWWQSLSYSHSWHFQWPWSYFKVTAASDSCDN